MTKKRQFKLFPVGHHLDGAKCTIVDIKTPGISKRSTVYRIKHDCCGRERDTKHSDLEMKDKKKTGICAVCSASRTRSRLNKEKPIARAMGARIGPPMWKPTSAGMHPPAGWMPR